MSTLEQVGKEIGLTRERVRQIQVEALRKLREIVEKNGLTRITSYNVCYTKLLRALSVTSDTRSSPGRYALTRPDRTRPGASRRQIIPK